MSNKKNLYSKLGVSSTKEDVHKAIEKLDKGLFPGSFCKIVKDTSGRDDYCSIFHSDGAGTKSGLAYMYYKETGDISVFRGIVRDAMIMNIDDTLCVGATSDIFLSNNLGRNNKLVSGEIIATIIDEYKKYSDKLTSFGLNVILCGGETADVGDLVKTLILDASIFTNMKRDDVINTENIKVGDVIIGLASNGQASYEDEYNSGIGSNGLTLARHGTLDHKYYEKYPECYDDRLEKSLVFFGKHTLREELGEGDLTIGKALLSPTRTYVPPMMEIIKKFKSNIHGVVHNTGGGQTKCIHYGSGIRYIKDNLFPVPKIFKIIQESSGTSWEEMYSVFNMGHRMEIYCDESIAGKIIQIIKSYNIESKIIGHCEGNTDKTKNSVVIDSEYGRFEYK